MLSIRPLNNLTNVALKSNYEQMYNKCTKQCNIIAASSTVGIAQNTVILEADRPFIRVQVFHTADLECCYKTEVRSVKFTWVKQAGNSTRHDAHPVKHSDPVAKGKDGRLCGTLTIEPVQLNDSGLYQCWLNGSDVDLISHGTYLQVFSECS